MQSQDTTSPEPSRPRRKTNHRDRENDVVQTFLPYPDFAESAKCLDNSRLGKQRIECRQILETLIAIDQKVPDDAGFVAIRGWRNHPAVLMWRGYNTALAFYTHSVEDEWTRRGYRTRYIGYDTNKNNITLSPTDQERIIQSFSLRLDQIKLPWWFGMIDFHSSHRAALLFKNYDHYKQFNWVERPTLDYWWPTHYPQLKPKT